MDVLAEVDKQCVHCAELQLKNLYECSCNFLVSFYVIKVKLKIVVFL